MKVIVKGAVAKLVNGNGALLKRILRVANPKWQWDKRTNPNAEKFVTFYDEAAKTFPAGLCSILKRELRKRGIPLDIFCQQEGYRDPVDPDLLHGKTGRYYQVAAVQAAVQHLRGVLEEATGLGKTWIIAAICAYLIDHDIEDILIVVPKKGLMVQTKRELEAMLGVDVGQAGDGRKQLDFPITVATAQTLQRGVPTDPEWNSKYRRMMPGHAANPQIQRFIQTRKALIVDEAHHGSADKWFKIAMMCRAEIRLGLTGTAFKRDNLSSWRLMAVTGPILHKKTSKEGIAEGFLAKPTVYFVDDRAAFGKKVSSYTRVKTPKSARAATWSPEGRKTMKPWVKIYRKAIVKNATLNRTIAQISKLLIHIGHPPLILSLHTGHLRRLKQHHEVANTKATILEGRVPLPVRAGVVRAFCEDKDRAILASTIFDEGEDIPLASALILAGGGKSRVNLIQRIGRVSRKKEDNSCVVIDFAHSHNAHTSRHALARLKECKSQGWEIVHVKSIDELFTLLRNRRARVLR